MKFLSPNEFTDNIFRKWFSIEKRSAFFGGLLIGLFTHFLLLAGTMMSQDGLCQSIRYYAGEAEISVGRWGVKLLEGLRANYAVSYLSAGLCILFVAIASVLVVSIFEIRSTLGAVLTAATMEVAPTLVVTMLYEYVSDLYFLALLFAVIAAYFLIRCPKKWVGLLCGAVFLMLSLSIYQSYFGVTVGICLMVTVKELLNAEIPWKKTVKSFLRYACGGILGFAFYFISVKIDQAIEGISASGYNGVSSLTPASVIRSLPSSLSNAYHSFVRYYLRDDFILNTNWHRDIFFLIFFLCFAVLIAFSAIRQKLYREPIRILFLAVFLLLLPAGLNVIALIVPDTLLYALTSMQMVLVIPFFFACMEKEGKIPETLAQWVGTVAVLILIVTYYFADVLSYRALQETYDQALYGANRILDRMETAEGYQKDMPVVFAGWFNDMNYPQDQSFWEYSLGFLVTNRTAHGDYYANTESIRRFYLQFPGIYLNMAPPALYSAVIETDTFRDMGIFPAADSVQIIDGVMVVKMMEDPYVPY